MRHLVLYIDVNKYARILQCFVGVWTIIMGCMTFAILGDIGIALFVVLTATIADMMLEFYLWANTNIKKFL